MIIIHTFIANSLTSTSQFLPIRMLTVGCNHKQEHIVSKGFKSHHILIIQDGRGIVKCNGEEYELSVGSVFYNHPNIPIEYKSTEGLKTAFITATGDALDGLCKFFNNPLFLYRSDINTEKYMKAINGIIEEYNERRRQSVLSKLTYAFYTDFFNDTKLNDATLTDKITDYLDKNFQNKITLEMISKNFNVSVSKLCHSFKADKNCTVFNYILNLRLSLAQNLLVSLPDSIKEVANQCGFDDVSYFCKAFKEAYGITPNEYRKASRE